MLAVPYGNQPLRPRLHLPHLTSKHGPGPHRTRLRGKNGTIFLHDTTKLDPTERPLTNRHRAGNAPAPNRLDKTATLSKIATVLILIRWLQMTRRARQWLLFLVSSLAILSSPASADLDKDLLESYRDGQEQWPPFVVSEGVEAEPLGRLPSPDLPSWQTPEVEELGKQLFFDPRLSGSGQLACASCHDPQLGWGDGRATSFGHDRRLGTRNAMTLLNVAYVERFFWDGRSSSLEEQALLPIEDPLEMAADLDEVLDRLNAIPGYREAFRESLDTPVVTASSLGKALAAFQRTLVSRPNRFDRFLDGHGELDDQEIHGLHLFRTRAKCMNCHHGPLLSDGRFHNIGLALVGSRHEDLGRFSITGREADKGAFRTPSLRDLTYTKPWMHNGLFVNLRGTLAAYNRGMQQGHRDGQPEMSPLIKPLELTPEELDALETFLLTLSERPARVSPPKLPPDPGGTSGPET